MAKKKMDGRVLLVDDEEAIRESLGELLDACGFEVLTAHCYDAACKVLKEDEEIEAIICDLKMPGKSGLEVLRYLNEKKLKIPLIFLTGFGTLESCQDAVKEGAFDYILKPIDNKDKIVYPLSHGIEKYRLEKKNEELKKEIIRMAREHEAILNDLLQDAELKGKVQKRIAQIVDKWEAK